MENRKKTENKQQQQQQQINYNNIQSVCKNKIMVNTFEWLCVYMGNGAYMHTI